MTHIGRHNMKSIVEEASSIVKAIEKAWERAERPQEFTIKIFEDVQRGFLGMTKKQAKVGIFFSENPQADRQRDSMREKAAQSTSTEREHIREQRPTREASRDTQPMHEKRKPSSHVSTTPSEVHAKNGLNKERRSPWTDEMEHSVSDWLTQLMQKSELPKVSFDAKRMGNRLHITFSKSVFAQEEKNTALFRSLSYLLLGMLRSKFKKEFRFLKVVLTATP